MRLDNKRKITEITLFAMAEAQIVILEESAFFVIYPRRDFYIQTVLLKHMVQIQDILTWYMYMLCIG